jgi:hypothetical protein
MVLPEHARKLFEAMLRRVAGVNPKDSGGLTPSILRRGRLILERYLASARAASP